MNSSQRHEQFSELLAKYQSQILGYILALVLHRDDAEDLFQESAVVMWKKFDQFDPATNFLSWACRIAFYEVSNFARKQRATSTHNFTALMDAFAAEDHCDDQEDALREALIDCLKKRKPQERFLLNMVYRDENPVADVAETLGRSSSGVSNSLLRIRKSLMDCVERTLRREDRL